MDIRDVDPSRHIGLTVYPKRDYTCINCGHWHVGRCVVCDSRGSDCDGMFEHERG